MKFRLSAGRPAPYSRSGFSTPEEIKSRDYWAPNVEPGMLLRCGCLIPWPVLTLRPPGLKVVLCDQHGWQDILKKDADEARKRARKEKSCLSNQATLDVPPF